MQPKLIFQIFVPEGFDRSSIVLLDPDKVRVVTLGSEEFLELQTARRGKTRLFYSARANDTLAKIAKRYGLSPGDLARVNRLSATSELAEGQRIVVYSPTPELPKEITARVTGASKKSAVASREVRRRGGKAASSKHDKATRSASAGQTPAARSRTRSTPAAKTSGKTSKGRTANGKH